MRTHELWLRERHVGEAAPAGDERVEAAARLPVVELQHVRAAREQALAVRVEKDAAARTSVVS